MYELFPLMVDDNKRTIKRVRLTADTLVQIKQAVSDKVDDEHYVDVACNSYAMPMASNVLDDIIKQCIREHRDFKDDCDAIQAQIDDSDAEFDYDIELNFDWCLDNMRIYIRSQLDKDVYSRLKAMIGR